MQNDNKQYIDYFHKKTKYTFPEGTRVFLSGKRLLVEINGTKTRNLNKYIVKNNNTINIYNRIGLPITGPGSAIAEEYEGIAEFFNNHDSFNFLDFEYATSHELVLCTFFKPMDFIWMKDLIQDVQKHLPYLVNIFRRPYIHLKETETLQSVDTAMRINHKTINHLSKHSENWKSIDMRNGSIEPDKLLTKIYIDDYSIYENVVFFNLINNISSFLIKTIYYLTEILETFNESIKLDAVNRFNHQMYYLAIGKLYVGFYNMENTSEVNAVLESAKQLYKQINQYKVRDVYTKNLKAKPINGEIKKTNLFSMHKDYKHVYYLSQKYKKKSLNNNDNGSYFLQYQSQDSYELFCQMLVLFSISNFNFISYSLEDIYVDGKVKAKFDFKNWKLTVNTKYSIILGLNTISINIKYIDKSIDYLFIPMSYYLAEDRKQQYENIIKRLYDTGEVYDKYLFFEPSDYDDNALKSYSIKYDNLYYAILPISISEINAFRRIQKVILELMILSNEQNDICAFCGEKMHMESDGHYVCKKCRTVIKEIYCEHCDTNFKASYFDVKKKRKSGIETLDGLSDFYKQERQYYFRNIVTITKNGYLCPYCGADSTGI